MKVLWCDTETTGLNPENSGAFEIAFIGYANQQYMGERRFLLNPLDEKHIYHESAYQAHGIPIETIHGYPSLIDAMPKIIEFLDWFIKTGVPEGEKSVFAGYNCNFDYDHIKSLFVRTGYDITKYFSGKKVDVLELVKLGIRRGAVNDPGNKKLGTMCKSFGINLENAHSALYDIRATRELAIQLHLMGVRYEN